MIDVRAALSVLKSWYNRYKWIVDERPDKFDEYARIYNALQALDDVVQSIDALHDEIRRLRVEAELSENWGERYAVLLTALYATADGATYRAVRAYETDVLARDYLIDRRIADFEIRARERFNQQAYVKQTLMARLNLDESEYFEYIITRSEDNGR